MPAPTNTAATTATDLGATWPVTVTQVADFAGTTYDLWFKRTVQAGETAWSIFPYGDASVYKPKVTAYLGPAAAPVLYLVDGDPNLAIQIPVDGLAGQVVYINVHANAGNPSPANLTLNLQLAPDVAVPAGSIGVNDDTFGFPAVFYSPTGTVLKYRNPFPSGDFVDVVPSGFVLAVEQAGDIWTLYDRDLGIVSHPVFGAGFTRISSNQLNRFYVGNATTGVVKTVDTAGNIGATSWDVGASLWAIAPSLDDTILYYVATGSTNVAIKRWDLVNNVALSDLVAGVANYNLPKTLLVQADGTILAGYRKITATKDAYVRHFSAAGATLHTYDFGAVVTLNQLSHAIADPVSFWVWLFSNSTSKEHDFREIRIADGVTLHALTPPQYTSGIYQGAATATPERFGNSDSCQFWITRAAGTTTSRDPTRRMRIFALPFNENKRLFLRRLELFLEQGQGLLTGQGADPQIMISISRDGGFTWEPEETVSAGSVGEYQKQSILNNLGSYRNGALKIVVSDPVAWHLCAAFADIEKGLH